MTELYIEDFATARRASRNTPEGDSGGRRAPSRAVEFRYHWLPGAGTYMLRLPYYGRKFGRERYLVGDQDTRDRVGLS